MRNIVQIGLTLLAILIFGALPTKAETEEKRIALVVGNADYQAGKLETPANDAGLIAQTLQAAGFDVVGARDLDQEALRRAFKDFLEKATSSGPDTVALIYLAGYGLQLEGENYFVPVDAKIAGDLDVSSEAVRLSDYIRPLNALKLKSTMVVLDAARQNPFAKDGGSLASGLALVEPPQGMMIAFNAAPGTVAPEAKGGSYGPYAQALAEMIREGGLPINDLFDRVRLRVNENTKGAQVPWHASKLQTAFVFVERSADAPAQTASTDQIEAVQDKPIRELSANDAYVAALDRDTMEGYEEFIETYPDDPMAKRVRGLLAARREAVTWRETRTADTSKAYWSYVKRYPKGPHVADARRRLTVLSAELDPPAEFEPIEYDVPPPPPEEFVYVERPVIIFDDPYYDFMPPPPPPIYWLPPPPSYVVLFPPPPPPIAVFVLPVPTFVPFPIYVSAPVYVRPPRNVYFENVHNEIVINNVTKTVIITDRDRRRKTMRWDSDDRSRDDGYAFAPRLPRSVEKRAAAIRTRERDGGVGSEAGVNSRRRGNDQTKLDHNALPDPTRDGKQRLRRGQEANADPSDVSGDRDKRGRQRERPRDSKQRNRDALNDVDLGDQKDQSGSSTTGRRERRGVRPSSESSDDPTRTGSLGNERQRGNRNKSESRRQRSRGSDDGGSGEFQQGVPDQSRQQRRRERQSRNADASQQDFIPRKRSQGAEGQGGHDSLSNRRSQDSGRGEGRKKRRGGNGEQQGEQQ